MNEFPVSRRQQTTSPNRMKRVIAAVLVAGSATFALSAWGIQARDAHGPGMPPGPPPMGMGLGIGPGAFLGGPGMNPARTDRMIDRMLDGLKATDAQRAQIKEIAKSAQADLRAQHERTDRRAMRDRELQIFGAQTLDPAAAEALRQQMLTRQDEASKRVLQAMLDIGRVLTPEQRAKAAERVRLNAERMDERAARVRSERPTGGPDEPRGAPPRPQAR